MWVSHRVTAVGSLTGHTQTVSITSGTYTGTGRIDEVQVFGIDPSGRVDVPPPATRVYPGDHHCSANPLTWSDCVSEAAERVSRVVTDGVVLVVEQGAVVIDGYRHNIEEAWELTRAIADSLGDAIEMVRRLGAGCASAIGDRIDELVSLATQTWEFITGPVQFLQRKVGEVASFVRTAMNDLTGTALAEFQQFVNWELLTRDPIAWLGSTGCGLVLDVIGGGAKLLAKQALVTKAKERIADRRDKTADNASNRTDEPEQVTQQPASDPDQAAGDDQDR